MFVTIHALLVEIENYQKGQNDDIIDYLILSDLDALVDFPHEVEPFILHLFSQSLSEKAVLQLYKKASFQEIRINKLISMVEDLSSEVNKHNKLVSHLQQDDNKIKSISKEAGNIQKKKIKINGSLSIIQSIIEHGFQIEIPIDNSLIGIFSVKRRYLLYNRSR